MRCLGEASLAALLFISAAAAEPEEPVASLARHVYTLHTGQGVHSGGGQLLNRYAIVTAEAAALMKQGIHTDPAQADLGNCASTCGSSPAWPMPAAAG
jgi:hypothetical protein